MRKIRLMMLSVFVAVLATGQTFTPGIPLFDRSFSTETGSDMNRPFPMFIRTVSPEEVQGMRTVVVSDDMGRARKNHWTVAVAPSKKNLLVGMKVMVIRLRVHITEGKDGKEVKAVYIVQE